MRILKLGVAFSFMTFLAACGGGSNSTVNDAPEGDEISAETFEDLPNCTENREGMEATTEDGGTYVCEDGVWEEAAEPVVTYKTLEDLPNCTAKREGSRAYVKNEKVTYVCSDGEWLDEDEIPDDNSKSSSSGSKDSDSDDSEKSSSSSKKTNSSDSEEPESNGSEEPESGDSSIYDAEENTLKDLRDGKTYRTVAIGGQVWMAENLNYETEAGSYCNGDSTANCNKYGRLYTWAAAVGKSESACGMGNRCGLSGTVRGACPKGWHLPSSAEFNALFSAVGGDAVSATRLKSTTGWASSGNGTDTQGFKALPAGRKDSYGEYENEATEAYFWTSVENPSNYAYSVILAGNSATATLYGEYVKGNAFSVRCLLDDGAAQGSSSSSEEESSSSEEPELDCSEATVPSDLSCYDATANTLTDLRDGQVYKTTTINVPAEGYFKVWMGENLNYATDNSWCFSGLSAYCDTYGRLYTWAAAMAKSEDSCGYGSTCGLSGTVRGACPKGWHVPRTGEYDTLLIAMGGASTAGTKLKSTSGWPSGGNGSDTTYSFSALPSGFKIYSDNSFSGQGEYAFFWTSVVESSLEAYYMYLTTESTVYIGYTRKDYAFPVRCLKDSD